ncbi:dUTP diphosphatase [Leclercia sp.]|uniref:dUTP diphosphatase n=1 Tax=Leclercia sp. TaxID=1898428 RepID=UPI0028B0A73A|nr:dUTP diphosphatase [Leclercia sp.]
MINMKIKLNHPHAKVPTYATDGSACFDLYCAEVVEMLSDTVTINTGLSVEIPEGFAMMVYSRSGHGFKSDTRLSNSVGVIDSDYRGEVMVKLRKDRLLSTPPDLRVGSRIAQAMLIPVNQVSFEVAEQLSESFRGSGGFGSSGA